MKTKTIVSLSCLLALFIFSIPSSQLVLAQESGFQESFDDASLPGWEVSPQVEVPEGLLLVNPGGFALHFGDWKDITMTVKLRFSGTGRAGVRYYTRDTGRYILLIGEEGLALDKESDHSRSSLGVVQVTIQPNTWLTLKIVVAAGQHQVFIDDNLLLTAMDTAPLEGGAIALGVEGETVVEYDDLVVTGTQVGGPPIVEEMTAVSEPGSSSIEPQATQPSQSESISGASSFDLLDEFFASQASVLDLTTFIINIFLSVICAYILGLVYIHWGSSLSNRRKFAANFLIMSVTTTFIILVVRSSVALSLGLVGALSIVRFRTAVKEPEELAYLFIAIGIGIGLGDNQRLITLVALAAIVIIIGLRYLFKRNEVDVNLYLSVASRDTGKVELEQIMHALHPYVSKIKLLRMDENRNNLEAGFLVEFAKSSDLSMAKSALKELSPTLEITFMDNKGLW